MTPEEKERIIEMRLAGVPVRQVAAEIPTTTKTVVNVFKAYCLERAREFREQAESNAAHIIERLWRIANDAAKAGAKADDATKLKCLAEERAALQALGKWFEGPIKVEHTGDGAGFAVIRIVDTPDEGE